MRRRPQVSPARPTNDFKMLTLLPGAGGSLDKLDWESTVQLPDDRVATRHGGGRHPAGCLGLHAGISLVSTRPSEHPERRLQSNGVSYREFVIGDFRQGYNGDFGSRTSVDVVIGTTSGSACYYDPHPKPFPAFSAPSRLTRLPRPSWSLSSLERILCLPDGDGGWRSSGRSRG